MSLSQPLSPSEKLSERLTPARIRQLAELVVKSEHPQPSAAVVTPLLELVYTVLVVFLSPTKCQYIHFACSERANTTPAGALVMPCVCRAPPPRPLTHCSLAVLI